MGTDVSEVMSTTRTTPLVKTRIIYASIARGLTNKTLGEIASLIGRDHATIIHYTDRKPSEVHRGLILSATKAFTEKHGHELEAFTDQELSVFDLNDKLKLRVFKERKRALENLRIIKGNLDQVKEKWVKTKLLPLIDEEMSRLDTLLELRDTVPEGQKRANGLLRGVRHKSPKWHNV
jgi:hypothetical protein